MEKLGKSWEAADDGRAADAARPDRGTSARNETPAQRSAIMRAVKSRDTRPELVVRKLLWSIAPGYRLYRADLPGKPDIVYGRRKLAIFVHGCFWHGHDCPMFKLPATRTEFWAQKIAGNRDRDRRALEALAATGWRTMVIWECTLKGAKRLPVEDVTCKVIKWLESDPA